MDSNKNDFCTSGDSVFESSSFTIENQKNLLDRFFNLFGTESDEGMCPASVDKGYASIESPWIERLWDFFIPETGGTYYCTDPSEMAPPSPFIGDIGDFCPDSD